MKDQLYRISMSEFYEWLFGPEKCSWLSRNGPLVKTLAVVEGEPIQVGHRQGSRTEALQLQASRCGKMVSTLSSWALAERL